MIADEIERIRKAIFVEGSSDELHDEDSSKKSNIILPNNYTNTILFITV